MICLFIFGSIGVPHTRLEGSLSGDEWEWIVGQECQW